MVIAGHEERFFRPEPLGAYMKDLLKIPTPSDYERGVEDGKSAGFKEGFYEGLKAGRNEIILAKKEHEYYENLRTKNEKQRSEDGN